MDKRLAFIDWIIGSNEVGYVGLAAKIGETEQWVEKLFLYPDEREQVEIFIRRYERTANLYFCPTIIKDDRRKKENIHTSSVLWADLDHCDPSVLLVEPSCIVETSPGRYQGYWKLSKPTHALDVEELNKRIAYYHKDDGVDTGGWDLTQLLRIPDTLNFKYHAPPPKILIGKISSELVYTIADFIVYPRVEGSTTAPDIPIPDILPSISAQDILARYRASINPAAWRLFEEVPEFDWSKNLWRLELLLFEAGCSREEVYIIALEAACNKFERDDINSTELLWKDIIRAETHTKSKVPTVVADSLESEFQIGDEPLLTSDEREFAEGFKTIVDSYVNWAKTNTDAAPEYHVASAFIILSSLLSGTIRLPTSFGTIIPNLWFMMLGDTTLTRKSTAMKMGMSFVIDVISDAILGTDGTIEGLLSEVALRPNMPSIFLRDEFTGLLEQMSKRDYHAGMMESFAHLYDGNYQKRVLRKETIEVRDPILIIFAGGIKEKTFQLLDYAHINSGFIPRFVFVTAEANLDKIRPIGPPTTANVSERAKLTRQFEEIYEAHVFRESPDDFLTLHRHEDVTLTTDAWVRYNQFEEQMTRIGHQSSMPDLLTPMMDRLCKSGLKAAVLLAASQQASNVVVDEHYLVKAFSYVERWKTFAIEVVTNAGKSSSEITLERVYRSIQGAGVQGMKRATLMRAFRFTAKEADNVFNTLEQRGLIRAQKKNGWIYYPIRPARQKAKR